jgi:hypothetical protein
LWHYPLQKGFRAFPLPKASQVADGEKTSSSARTAPGTATSKGGAPNVFKLFEAVDLNEHRLNPILDQQLAFYDVGVGTKG